MPKKLRLRRVLKPVAPPLPPKPVSGVDLTDFAKPITAPLQHATARLQHAIQDFHNFSLSAQQAHTAFSALSGVMAEQRDRERADDLYRRTRFVPTAPTGPFLNEPELYAYLRSFFDQRLAEAYERVLSLNGSDQYDYSTALILQTDVIYLFLEMGPRRVSLCRINDGYATVYDMRGRVGFSNINTNSLLAEAVRLYMCSRHFHPDHGRFR